jgi:hypothetical protein
VWIDLPVIVFVIPMARQKDNLSIKKGKSGVNETALPGRYKWQKPYLLSLYTTGTIAAHEIFNLFAGCPIIVS